jgi:hypothetical protein
MTPERWQQIKQVFNSALERTGNERPGFLAEACGNDVHSTQTNSFKFEPSRGLGEGG